MNDELRPDGEFDSIALKRKKNYWYDANFNPFGKNVGDCLIRALSAALMMRYDCVCRRMGYSIKAGVGMERSGGGELQKAVEKFPEFMEAVDVPSGVSDVESFISKADPGIYVAVVKDHAVCAVVQNVRSKSYFVDSWDSGKEKVVAALKVVQQVPRNSMERLKISQFRQLKEAYDVDPENVDGIYDRLFGVQDQNDWDMWLAQDDILAALRPNGIPELSLVSFKDKFDAFVDLLENGDPVLYELDSVQKMNDVESPGVYTVRLGITSTSDLDRIKDHTLRAVKTVKLGNDVFDVSVKIPGIESGYVDLSFKERKQLVEKDD